MLGGFSWLLGIGVREARSGAVVDARHQVRVMVVVVVFIMFFVEMGSVFFLGVGFGLGLGLVWFGVLLVLLVFVGFV